MSGVIVTFKVMPTGTDVNLDMLEAKIREVVGADQVKREPIAFGIVALIIAKMIPDEAGFIDKMEELLRGVEGVGEVETLEVTKAL
jgi:elongation factor 1-beta